MAFWLEKLLKINRVSGGYPNQTEEPYDLRRMLGWCIVGPVGKISDKSSKSNLQCNKIAVREAGNIQLPKHFFAAKTQLKKLESRRYSVNCTLLILVKVHIIPMISSRKWQKCQLMTSNSWPQCKMGHGGLMVIVSCHYHTGIKITRNLWMAISQILWCSCFRSTIRKKILVNTTTWCLSLK